MPGDIELVLYTYTAVDIISHWKYDNNNASNNAHSHSLEITFDCPTFSL